MELLGVLSHVLLKGTQGETREISPLIALIALLRLLRNRVLAL